jgi:nitrite reductase (NO-forming)
MPPELAMTPTENRHAPSDSRLTAAGAPGRVSAVHQQARRTLRIAALFTLAAPVAAIVPHRTGAWLPLHLFLVGGLLSAISGATQLLAVTWSAAPAPKASLATLQRWLLAAGASGLALARELDAPVAALAGAGSLVIAALVLLGALLVQIRATAVVARFHPAIDGYLLAIFLGVTGSVAGVLLATGAADDDYAQVRAVHLTINLLGLVGLVIAATIPFFIATQARTKTSPRATPIAVRFLVGVMAAAVIASSVGRVLDRPSAAAAGLAAYAVAVLALFALFPPLGRRQLEWAGPRLLQLIIGVLWWAVTTGMLAASAMSGEAIPEQIVLALVIGGYAQILVASLAYFAPVLRGGGHRCLTAGFAITRSWTSLIVGNVAAVAALTQQRAILAGALTIWAGDTAIRAVRLLHIPTATREITP